MSNDLSSLEEWNHALGVLLQHQGDQGCPHYLVQAINTLVKVEAVMLTLERSGEAPVLLYDIGIPEDKRDLYIDAYFSGAYLLDPLCLSDGESIPPGFYPLAEVAPDDFYNSDYYRTYYQNTALVDDVFLIAEPQQGVRLSIALGRYGDQAKFTVDELRVLRSISSIVQACMGQYWDYVQTQNSNQQWQTLPIRAQVEAAFRNFGCSVLTQRERQVALLLLRGHSSKSAAQKLEISPETVQMHRKRLYLKLDIGSQSELFSLFIEALSNASGLEEDPLMAYINKV